MSRNNEGGGAGWSWEEEVKETGSRAIANLWKKKGFFWKEREGISGDKMILFYGPPIKKNECLLRDQCGKVEGRT